MWNLLSTQSVEERDGSKYCTVFGKHLLLQLCDNLIDGGTTPSYGMISRVRLSQTML